jgi:D-serine deaminase-like pyridoxal phosphate-dependent protein
VYYKDIIIDNTEKTIAAAGGAERLWPHVKTHKMAALVKIQQAYGVSRFKAATIAECEMLARCGAGDILLAYPLVGPNIERFIKLARQYPGAAFWAVGDNFDLTAALAAEAKRAGLEIPFLADVDIGMLRTGVPLSMAEDFFARCARLEGINVRGLHCFNGNYKITDITLRKPAVDQTAPVIFSVRNALVKKGLHCPVLVLGSTPSMPCYAEYPDIFISPGTSFVTDYGYHTLFPDLPFLPGAALLSRVIAQTGKDMFTLDLGYKAIAADPKGIRGIILGLEDAQPVFHCEEHWVFRIPDIDRRPAVGSLLYVIPTHICPTTALFPYALSAQGGEITGRWEVSARDRIIAVEEAR